MDFAHMFSKNYIFFVFFNKHYTFYTKESIHSAQKLRSKHFVQRKMQKFS